jgi:uncharacterized integral membrane protein
LLKVSLSLSLSLSTKPTNTIFTIMVARFLFALLSLVFLAHACTVNSDCGSFDATLQPGLCQAGVCQCGVGYVGNIAVDPTSCSLLCTPVAVPDSVAFLNEPIVDVTASAGNLRLDIELSPFLKQTPTTMALLNPTNGSRCSLMPEELGLGRWAQTVDSQSCHQSYVYQKAFALAVAQSCWATGAPVVETGSQYAVTFSNYQTQVEVIQQGLAPFGQLAVRAVRESNETTITRAFRRDYTISVATRFVAQSLPFSVVAPIVLVGPVAVNDTIATSQTVAVTIAVLDNDVNGTTQGEVEPILTSTLTIVTGPLHGSTSVNTTSGLITYTPTGLYHGPDSFTYQICDANLLCSIATVAVTVTPVPPVALDDAVRTNYSTAVDVDVLSNDSAGAGGLVTVTLTTPVPIGVGIATVTGANHVSFVPAAGFAGRVEIVYQVCDASTPTVLCASATLSIDVGGVGPIAVNDVATVDENGSPIVINVLGNDLAGTSPLNASSVSIISGPVSGGVASVNAITGSITFTPATGFHGDVTLTYQVCDAASPTPVCDNATVTITVSPRGPNAVDDSASTSYTTPVTIAVLGNDLAGAQPLNVSSVSITRGPSANGATAVVIVGGSIQYAPAAGFVGTDSFEYSVCDTSIPTPLCDIATVTVVVNGQGVRLRYRLVTIDYDVTGHAIGVTVQTQTSNIARVANVTVATGIGGSTGIASVIGLPVTGASCDANSAPGSCDQFHVIRFSDTPCSVSGAELVLSVVFTCANGSNATMCGFVNVNVGAVYRLPNLLLSYDACPRVVQYGVNAQQSWLRLHVDAPRTVVLATPSTQGATVYGRCSIVPTAGAQFQSVTLSSLAVIRQDISGPTNLGNKLAASFMSLVSTAVQTSPSNPVWDFDMALDATFFSITETYYLEATLELVFTNTGPLTRRLRFPLINNAASTQTMAKSLRQQLSFATTPTMDLVAVFGRATSPSISAGGIYSQTFRMLAASATTASIGATAAVGPATTGTSSPLSSSSLPMIIGIAVGVAAIVAGIVLIAFIVIRRRRLRDRANSDTPLVQVSMDGKLPGDSAVDFS